MKAVLAATALLAALLLPAAQAAPVDTITAEGIVDAPVGEVWAAWATSAGLRSWLAPQADIDLRIGGMMRAAYDPKATLGDDTTIENRVLSFEPERMLSIQVARAPANFAFRARVANMWTVLYFEPASEGRTKLRIVGLGFEPDAESQRMKAFFERGNAYTLAQLQQRFRR